MRFYRGLQPFKVMSFDLDDTLYDNSDVIRLAEEHFLQCVQEHAQLSDLTSEYWREWKWQLAEKDSLTGIIIVTHNMGVATYMADKIVVMQNGVVVDSGTREEVINNPKSDYTKKLLKAIPEMDGERFV